MNELPEKVAPPPGEAVEVEATVISPEEAERRADFYQKLRARITEWSGSGTGRGSVWADVLLAAPDLFHVLCKLALDPEVPRGEKARLAAAIVYFMSPLDLIPDMVLGPIGWVDDAALACYVLHRMLNGPHAAAVRRHWAGNEDVLAVVQRLTATINERLGPGLVGRLLEKIR